MAYFTHKELLDLHQAIVNAGHLADGVWAASLSSLLPAYRGLLQPPVDTAPNALTILSFLNTTTRLVDGTIPIEVTLATLRILSPVEAVSRHASTLLARLEGLGPGWDGKNGPAAPYQGQQEAYTGDSDDMLPFEFLLGGHVAGNAVVKLVVPRFENGQPAQGPQGPRKFNGTGWFVTKELIITNFHVVCARESSEDDPSAADLDEQIAGIEVQLNYDRTDAKPVTTTAVKSVSFGARGGHRDYALIRVDPPATAPTPLRLRPEPPSIPKTGFAVNIIQHPAGLPKRVAARANLLKAASVGELQYFGDTLGGASGSPLFNDRWEVIGLHRASGPASGVLVKGKPASAYNVGIPIRAVLDDIQANAPNVFAELEPAIAS